VTPWLSVVIPTVGRPTLRYTLESIRAQPESEGVEVLVVADTFGGQTPELAVARAYVEDLGAAWLEHDAGLHCVGQPQRTFGASLAKAPWVWFSQDDNIAAEDSFAAIETAIEAQPRIRPLFFRFVSYWGQTIWREPVLQPGNIDADCLVFPRAIAHEVQWGLRYEGDFDAAYRACELMGGDVGWCDEVVSISRPPASNLWWKT
jgi:Glycosyl transferase family 2